MVAREHSGGAGVTNAAAAVITVQLMRPVTANRTGTSPNVVPNSANCLLPDSSRPLRFRPSNRTISEVSYGS